MNFEVFSRRDMQFYMHFPDKFYDNITPSMVISINSSDEPCLKIIKTLQNKINYVLSLQFDDIEPGDYEEKYLVLMSKEDAKKIADFVNLHKHNVNTIIVHCDAGVSRSAGVCAAIMKAITGDDMKIFNNKEFFPNIYCYKLVLNAFFEED